MPSADEIEELERQFPKLAGAAFAAARAEALAAGLTVVESRDAMLWEFFPDATRRAIKAIEPSTRVVRGSRFKIS